MFDPYDILITSEIKIMVLEHEITQLKKAYNLQQSQLQALVDIVSDQQVDIHRLKGLPEIRLRR